MELPIYYDYKNEVNSRINPSTMHAKNTGLVRYYQRYLLQRAMSVFKWDLPETWSKNYFLYILYCFGYIAVVNTDKYGVICQQCGLQGYDVFYQPTRAVIANPLLRGILNPRIGLQCELIRLQPDYGGIMDIVDYYADMLALSAETAGVDLLNSKLSYVFGVGNKAQAESMKKLFDRVASGEPASFTDKRLFTEDGRPNWLMFNQDLKNTYIVTEILQDMRKWLNMFDSAVGIANSNTEKKERMLVDEINSNNHETLCLADSWLEELKKSCEKVKQMFGIDIGVEWRFKHESNAIAIGSI